MSLVTLAEAKTYLKITSSNYDTTLNFLLTKAQESIENHINRKLDEATRYEVYNGTNKSELILDFYPITTMTLISDDISIEDREYNSTVTLNEVIINYLSGCLEYVDSIWVKGNRNIYIEYKTGFVNSPTDTYPQDLKMVCLEYIAKKFYDIDEKRLKINTKNIMSENIQFIPSDLSKENRLILQGQRDYPNRMGVAVSQFSAA